MQLICHRAGRHLFSFRQQTNQHVPMKSKSLMTVQQTVKDIAHCSFQRISVYNRSAYIMKHYCFLKEAVTKNESQLVNSQECWAFLADIWQQYKLFFYIIRNTKSRLSTYRGSDFRLVRKTPSHVIFSIKILHCRQPNSNKIFRYHSSRH